MGDEGSEREARYSGVIPPWTKEVAAYAKGSEGRENERGSDTKRWSERPEGVEGNSVGVTPGG
jgi:hypothetical protein